MNPTVTVEHAQNGNVKLTTITLYTEEDRQEMSVAVPPVFIPSHAVPPVFITRHDLDVAAAEAACGMHEPTDRDDLEANLHEARIIIDEMNDECIVKDERIAQLERQANDLATDLNDKGADLATQVAIADHLRLTLAEANQQNTGLRQLKDTVEAISRENALRVSDLLAAASVREAELEDALGGLREANRQREILQSRVNEYVRWQKSRSDGRAKQEALGPRYIFHEIPMEDLPAFKEAIAPFFNSDRYTMRVRGQHVKPDVTGGARRLAHQGHALDRCTHARIYIDEKVQVY